MKIKIKEILYCEISQVYKNEKVKWTMKDIVYLSEDVQSSTGWKRLSIIFLQTAEVSRAFSKWLWMLEWTRPIKRSRARNNFTVANRRFLSYTFSILYGRNIIARWDDRFIIFFFFHSFFGIIIRRWCDENRK